MSLKNLTDMLNKQKLVDGMVHSQQMHKHDFVESLLQRQHDAELHNFIAKQSSTELGGYLDSLPLDDAEKLWKKYLRTVKTMCFGKFQMNDALPLQVIASRALKTAKSMCTNSSMDD